MSDVYVYMHKHASLGKSGGMLPMKFLEIRCSEIAWGAVTLGQKQSHSSYMARKVLHPIFGCPYMHLLCQLTLNFHESTMVDRTAGGVTDGEIICREYARRASSLHDSKMSIDYQYTMYTTLCIFH